MKYKITEYKVEYQKKLIIDSVEFTEAYNQMTLKDIEFNKLERNLNTKIIKYIKTNSDFDFYINFKYDNITFYCKMNYDLKKKIFYLDYDNFEFFPELSKNNKLEIEINNIENKLKEINIIDLINFILNYNKD